MDDGAKPAEQRAVPAWATSSTALPGAKRASLAFRILPILSRLYWFCETMGVLNVSAFRAAYRNFYFAYKGLVEDPFDGLVTARPSLFEDGNVVDVGAHIGYTTSLFLRKLSPAFRVFAIEPDSVNVRELRETVRRLNAERRVVIVEAAAGHSDGCVQMWHNTRHPGDHRVASEAFRSRRGAATTQAVPLRCVDSVLAEHGASSERLAFVKIDVQGYELAVCEGMGGMLDRNPHTAVAIEYAPTELEEQGVNPDALLAFFRSRGYGLHLLTKDGRTRPLATSHLGSALKRRGYADLLCLPNGAD